jgi:hypothetical protein
MIIYVISTIYAFLLIYGAVRDHSDITAREYIELKDLASSAGVLGWKTASFKEDIRDTVASAKSLQAVIISAPGDYSIAVEKTHGLVKWTGNYPYFSRGLYLLKRLEPAPLRIEGLQNIVISAVSTYIDFDNLLFILRKVLLAILIAVVVSFSLLITDMVIVKKQPAIDEFTGSGPNVESRKAERYYPDDYEEQEPFIDERPQADKFSGNGFTTDDNENFILPPEPDFARHDAPFVPKPEDILFTEDESKFEEKDPFHVTDSLRNEDAEDDLTAGGLPQFETDDENSRKNPFPSSGLYETDPFGDFSGEPSFASELAPEMAKAEENGKDLSLITAMWTAENVLYKTLEEAAAGCFKRGSRIFEKNVPGIYIIVPGISIDDAFETAKRFHREAIAKLPLESESELLIGISSMAGRSLHAERLINEAERALGKAGEDRRSPIVAFKADPEKYKAFLEKKARASRISNGNS